MNTLGQDNKPMFSERVLNLFKANITKPTIGTILTAVSSLLVLINLIIYVAAFKDGEMASYYHYGVTLCASLAFAIGLLLLSCKHTASYAPVVMLSLQFGSFLIFMRNAYMYFSKIFYGGFSLSLFFQMHYGYLCMILLSVIIFIVLLVSCFLKQTKHIKKEVKTNECQK